ncbi:MAG TPA: NAD(P)-binding domain-containing protein [Steroidobacteraceae bacterium]|jgi:predicted dinucleotide-binding enzyme|nr:NAD(P)-binding domain-containing protein [Steroidobacteraceae bacterium]
MSTPDRTSKTVAILGNGTVGTTLGQGFAELGYQVVFGTRDVTSSKTRTALSAVKGSRAASPGEAAAAGDLAVLALPWLGLEAGILAAGAHNFAGKLVIDPSNPLDFTDDVPRFAIEQAGSAGELVQHLLPASKVVKAFNIVTAQYMVFPRLADGTPDMFIAGDDAEAKAEVTQILKSFGWREPIDAGPIRASRLLEAMAMLWVLYGVKYDHWTHAFSLLGRKA